MIAIFITNASNAKITPIVEIAHAPLTLKKSSLSVISIYRTALKRGSALYRIVATKVAIISVLHEDTDIVITTTPTKLLTNLSRNPSNIWSDIRISKTNKKDMTHFIKY